MDFNANLVLGACLAKFFSGNDFRSRLGIFRANDFLAAGHSRTVVQKICTEQSQPALPENPKGRPSWVMES